MKAVLLLHGFATDRNDFSRLVPFLWPRYDEVLCPNLPAHGVGAEKERLDHKKIIEFAVNAFDGLKSRHQNVDVIGFSMGGALASQLASIREVNRLVLLAPANKYLAPGVFLNTFRYISDYRHEYKAKKSGKAVQSQNNISIKEMLEDTSDALKLFFGEIVKKYTPKNISEFGKVVKNCNLALGEICIPTLVMWGKLDQFVPFTSIRHIVSHCRHNVTRSIVYPDVSHLMLYSRAHYRITDDILCFLEETEPLLLTFRHKTGII